MNESKISVRYAKALFESAKEKGLLDEVRKDILEVQVVSQIPEFNNMLTNPVIRESQKKSVLHSIFKNKIQALSLSLLDLVFKNGRESYIPGITRNFMDLYRKHKGIRSAVFTSARPVSDIIRKRVEDIIHKTLNAPIELKTQSDEELIGGFVIRLDDRQYDASVANSLKKIKKQLLN
jgi:F-type H+-transporting ATPase subunit delta